MKIIKYSEFKGGPNTAPPYSKYLKDRTILINALKKINFDFNDISYIEPCGPKYQLDQGYTLYICFTSKEKSRAVITLIDLLGGKNTELSGNTMWCHL